MNPLHEKICIYGGTFNPIHIGHLLTARAAIEACNLDRLILMPSGNSYKKEQQTILNSSIRSKLVELSIQGESKMELSLMEIERGDATYTYETMTEMKKLYPDAELFFLMGADALLGIDTWKNPEIIFQSCHILAAARKGCERERLQSRAQQLERQFGGRVTVLTTRQIDISSSEIRERILRGQSVRYMIADPAYEYISSHNLYSEVSFDEISGY